MEDLEKQLMQSQIEVQEATFATLGKDLHDNVGQLLSSAKILLGVAQRNTQNSPATLAKVDETLSTAINALRSLTKALDIEWLEQFSLIDNVLREIDRNNDINGIQIHFSYPPFIPLDTKQQTILFRIVQESMQNSIKHAEAQNIHVVIEEDKSSLKIIVKDDGKGFNTDNMEPKGVGIINIRHRTKLLGGTVQWRSILGTGTTLSISLPFQNDAL